jgi:D-alanyl-D-alanine dipeptidase
MPGLVPGIHVLLGRFAEKDVDGRDKPGHDEQCSINPSPA